MILMMCKLKVILLLLVVVLKKISPIILFFEGMPLFQHNSISSASCLQNAAPPPLMNWPRSQPQLTPGQGGASFSGQRGATPNPHPHPHHTPEAMQTSWYVFFYIFPPTSPKKTKNHCTGFYRIFISLSLSQLMLYPHVSFWLKFWEQVPYLN